LGSCGQIPRHLLGRVLERGPQQFIQRSPRAIQVVETEDLVRVAGRRFKYAGADCADQLLTGRAKLRNRQRFAVITGALTLQLRKLQPQLLRTHRLELIGLMPVRLRLLGAPAMSGERFKALVEIVPHAPRVVVRGLEHPITAQIPDLPIGAVNCVRELELCDQSRSWWANV
jgi:hypothetical protein